MPDICKSPMNCLTGADFRQTFNDQELWDQLKESSRTIELKVGEVLTEAAVPFSGIACISRGSMQRRIHNGDAQFVLAQLMVQGDLLGLECLLDKAHCQDQYWAREKTTICLYPAEPIQKLMMTSPAVLHHFFSRQSEYFKEMMTHLQVLSNKSLQSRTAAGVLYFSGKLGNRPWTNREIASWAGVTQEGVGRSFTNMISEGIIRKTGRRTFIQKEGDLVKMASEFKQEKAPHLVSYLVGSATGEGQGR